MVFEVKRFKSCGVAFENVNVLGAFVLFIANAPNKTTQVANFLGILDSNLSTNGFIEHAKTNDTNNIIAKIICLIVALTTIAGSGIALTKYTQHKKETKTMETTLDINNHVEKYKVDKNAVLLDVRTKEEVQTGKIPNSQNIPLDEIDKANFDKNKTIYVYCRSGRRSQMATEILKSKGYNAINIGGIEDYTGNLDL